MCLASSKTMNYSATWLLVSLPRALLQLNNVFAHSLSLLNSFSKNVEKLFNESSSAEIRPPEVPEITLRIKVHGSARNVVSRDCGIKIRIEHRTD